MIIRRYGTTAQSVAMNFDSKALNEIGFRRDHDWSLEWVAFEDGWERVDGYELATEAEGFVHDEAEQALLDRLEGRIRELEESLGSDEVLLVESESGKDYPKTRQVQRNVVVEGENRLHFQIRMDPPLKLGRYRRRP